MLDMETGSCSSDFSSDAFHWDDCPFSAPASARRSSRKRTFNKSYDVDFPRMLGGKGEAPHALQGDSGSWPLSKPDDSSHSLLQADTAALHDPDNLGDFLGEGHAALSSGFNSENLPTEGLDQATSAFDDLLQDSALDTDFFGESLHLDSFYHGFGSYIPDTSDASSPCSTEETFSEAPVPEVPTSRKSVLVAKVLTKSDAHAKRIILPRVAVEANLSVLLDEPTFVMTAKDTTGKDWRFVVKSWSNGHNPKPVYVMEQVADYLRHYRLGVGDAVGILVTEQGLLIEHNSAEVRSAAERPTYCGFSREELASILLASHPNNASTASSDKLAGPMLWSECSGQTNTSATSSTDNAVAHMGGVLLCLRTSGCSRPAGHQGWCSGHKGFKRRRTSADAK